MTLAKRLLLGTAAAFVATSGAHAADLGLPVAPSVDYVQVCSIGGFTGFILPGGDVCFDISGYARGQVTWSEEIDPFEWSTGTAISLPDVVRGDTALTGATGGNFVVNDADGVASTIRLDSDGSAGELDGTPELLLNNTDAQDLDELATTVNATTIAGFGYGAAVDAVNVGWNAFTIEDDGSVTAGDLGGTAGVVNAFAGAISFANTATMGITGFAAADYITGLEVLNVAGDNDEADFTGNARINFDARTMTEYGLLRGFIRLDGENGTAANVDRAFVQLNVGSLGFTAGLADSVFDPVFTGYGSGTNNGLDIGDEASNQFSVNASVGNGVTVSLSVEDDDDRQAAIYALAESTAAPATLVAGNLWTLSAPGYDGAASIPDVIAALRVDQAWGSAKLAAALHEVNPGGDYANVDSEFGYAVSASAEFNIPVGVGSTFGITGIYANGAQGFMGFTSEVGNTSTGYADAIIVDTDVAGQGSLDLTTSYMIAAGFNFGLSSMVALSIDGSYADVDHAGSLFDGNVYHIRGGIAYTPVNNLTINAHVAYSASDFNTSALRTAVDDDEWSARFRVTRSF